MSREDEPIGGLDLLQAPPPRPGFWDDLRTALADQATQEERVAQIAQATLHGNDPAGTHHGRRILLVTVAAVTVAFVLLAAVVTWRDPPTSVPASPTPSNVVIVDPMRIDLDRWATNPPDTAAGPFTVFDVDNLPSGWRAASPGGGSHAIGDPDPDHYRWSAQVTADSGRKVVLSARSPEAIDTANGTAVTVNGRPGTANGDTLAWFDPSGVALTVTSPDATPQQLVDLAEALQIVTIDALPTAETAELATQAPMVGTPRLSGVIAGIPWTVASAADATTGLSLNVDRRPPLSYEGMPRTLESTWDINVAGLGANGALIYGIAPARTAAARIVLDSATVTLPVAHDTNGHAVYAIPVAPGLRLRRLELLTADGAVLHRMSIPRILTPAGDDSFLGDQPLNSRFPAPPGAETEQTLDEPAVASTTPDNTAAASGSPCTSFTPIYIGQGLTASLPIGSTSTGGESTAATGPIHAGWAADFDVQGGTVTVGRRLGTNTVAEPNLDQRVDGDVVVFVKATDPTLRSCILDSTGYDQARDEQDE